LGAVPGRSTRSLDVFKNMPPLKPISKWTVVQFFVFVAIVIVWLNVSVELALRMVGVLTIAGGAVQMWERKIAYGWEGHEPSGYITGIPAFLISAILIAAGVVLVVAPQLAMPFFAAK
jgi:hypothetical protein